MWLASFDFDDFNTQHRPEVMTAILKGIEKFLIPRTKHTNGLTIQALKRSHQIINQALVIYPNGIK